MTEAREEPPPLVLDLGESLDRPETFTLTNGLVLEVRHVSPDKAQEFRRRLGLPGWKPEGEKLSPAQNDALAELNLDWMLVGWNLRDRKTGGTAPCTLETKLTAARQHAWLLEKLTELSQRVYWLRQAEASGELGNSQGSSADSPSGGTTSAGSRAEEPTPETAPSTTSKRRSRRARRPASN